jgi:hypothetical protein
MSYRTESRSTYGILWNGFHKHNATSKTFVFCDFAVHEFLNVLSLDFLVCASYQISSWELFTLSADCKHAVSVLSSRHIHCYSYYAGICDGGMIEKQCL